MFSNTNNKDVWPVLTLNLEIIGHTGIIRVHPLSTYAKYFEELTFLTPGYAHECVRAWGYEMLVLWNICVRTELLISFHGEMIIF